MNYEILKRSLDIVGSTVGILIFTPIILICAVLIYLYDFGNPFYISPRVGKNRKIYKMLKLRTMIINAHKSGVDSTSKNDSRITPLGGFLRALKLDELPQLYNVFLGSMSLVGPRPNVETEVNLYTCVEENLLKVKPGVTDISSIVFADLADILKGSKDVNLSYNQLVRPWKSRLGLFYIEHRSLLLDLTIIFLTIIAIFNRTYAIDQVSKILKHKNAPADIVEISKRESMLVPYPPPGANTIITER